MFYRLKRHPLPVCAHFKHSLVLTYAFPQEILQPLLPPGLEVDTHNGFGFIAVATVQTEKLRPAFMPECLGQDSFLAGYRVFTRLNVNHRNLRGLRILRSDTDRRLMVVGGNLLTHYNYRKCDARIIETPELLELRVCTPDAQADLHAIMDRNKVGTLPPDSPFKNKNDALRFAGPLPFTFDYEPQTHSMIIIKGVRENWRPQLVNVDVRVNTFLQQSPFAGAAPVLASAFHVHDIEYRWECGIRQRLPEVAL